MVLCNGYCPPRQAAWTWRSSCSPGRLEAMIDLHRYVRRVDAGEVRDDRSQVAVASVCELT
jgi:hypothetical protein